MTIKDGLIADERPNVAIEGAALALDAEERARIRDGAFDLQSIADDRGIRHQSRDPAAVVFRNARRIEIGEGLAVRGALGEDRRPGEPGLRSFENQEFEEASIVVHGNAPFIVVIRDVEIAAVGPWTAGGDIGHYR